MILEIGSGTDDFHRYLDNPDVIHFDISKNAGHLESLGDVHKLPFKDGSFKIVYMSHVLEHCDNPLQVLRELKRVSTHKVVIKIPNIPFYRFLSHDPTHIYGWNDETLERLLKKVFPQVNVTPNFRVRKGRNKLKNILLYLKFFYYRFVFETDNELIAICET